MHPIGPEQSAYLELLGAIGAVILLADLALLWVLLVGWMRGRSLLAPRWSAAHVLIAFQAWLLPTLLFLLVGGIAAALVSPPGHGAFSSESTIVRWLMLAALVVQNAAMVSVVLFAVLGIYDQYWVATGLSLRHWAPRMALGIVTAAVVIPISQGLEWLSILALHHQPFVALLQRAYQQQWQELSWIFRGSGGLVLSILIVGILAPFSEEVFFRGFVYRCFRVRWGPAVGIVASAAFFSAIHVHPVGFLPILFIGCILAYLYERTGTLVAPISLHALNNIVAVVLQHYSHGK
jgi:membrane protease YdiL (CAAX protease family)